MLDNILALGSNHVGWEIQHSRNFFYKKQTGELTASHVKSSGTIWRVANNFNPETVYDMEPFLSSCLEGRGPNASPLRESEPIIHGVWSPVVVFFWAAWPHVGVGEGAVGTLCVICPAVSTADHWQRPCLPKSDLQEQVSVGACVPLIRWEAEWLTAQALLLDGTGFESCSVTYQLCKFEQATSPLCASGVFIYKMGQQYLCEELEYNSVPT